MSTIYFFNIGDRETDEIGNDKNLRCWEDNLKYQFVSAGHDNLSKEFPTRTTLQKIKCGDFILAYASRLEEKIGGYVGYGKVIQESTPLKDFVVKKENKKLADLPLMQPNLLKDIDDKELCEYVLGIEWIKTWSRKEGLYCKGMFVYPGTSCVINFAQETKRKKKEILRDLLKRNGIDI